MRLGGLLIENDGEGSFPGLVLCDIIIGMVAQRRLKFNRDLELNPLKVVFAVVFGLIINPNLKRI